PGRRSMLASSFGASTADVDRAPPGPVRLTRTSTRVQPCRPSSVQGGDELVAPMICKGAPPLVAERPPELRQDQQTTFRALVRNLMRPKSDQARQVARPECLGERRVFAIGEARTTGRQFGRLARPRGSVNRGRLLDRLTGVFADSLDHGQQTV